MFARKLSPVFLSAKGAAPLIFFAIALIVLGAGMGSASSAPGGIRITKEGLVSADIVNLPLEQVLTDLSRKLHLDIQGKPEENEPVTLHFLDLTPQEAVRRIMTDYNYVLIEPERGNGPLTVMVLGKTDKTARQAVAPSMPQANGAPSPLAPPVASATPVTSTPADPPPLSPLPENALPAAAVVPPPPQPVASTPPGIEPAPAGQPEFDAAAWGGIGRRERGGRK